MQELGLLEITNKQIKRKGKDHRFFKMKSNIFIIPDATQEEIKEKGLLKKIFRDGIKITSIGIASFVSWSYLKLVESTTKVQLEGGGEKQLEIPDPLVTALIVIIIGLCGEVIYLKIKKSVRSPIRGH